MNTPRLKAVQPADLPNLLGILTEGFPSHSRAQWEQRFETWWKNNPFLKPGMPIGWALEDRQSAFVGFMGSVPVKFLVNGREDTAVAASSWYVKPSFRGVYSLSFLLAFLRQQTPGLFLSTTPTETVAQILRQLDFASLEFPFRSKEYWLVLRVDDILGHVVRRYFKTARPWPLPDLAKIPFQALWRLYHLPRNKSLARYQNARYRSSLVSSCDGSFTELWESSRKEETTTLYRDAETLNWLLSSRDEEGSRMLIQCTDTREHRIKGYMLFDLDLPDGASSQIMHLKDLFLPSFEEEALLCMIAYAIGLAKERNISLLKLWATNTETDRVLSKHIPFQKAVAYPYLYKFGQAVRASIAPNQAIIPSLIDPDRGLI